MMSEPDPDRQALSKLRGASRLVVDAVAGVTDIAQALHRNIAWVKTMPSL